MGVCRARSGMGGGSQRGGRGLAAGGRGLTVGRAGLAAGRGAGGPRLTLRPPSSPTLPALDWQLPSHSGPYELRIEVQPKSHHRAHYETEGSRGAVKASAGGHPSVQVPRGPGRGVRTPRLCPRCVQRPERTPRAPVTAAYPSAVGNWEPSSARLRFGDAGAGCVKTWPGPHERHACAGGRMGGVADRPPGLWCVAG